MHVLEFFSDGCALCERHLETIRANKCDDCELVVFDRAHPEWSTKKTNYNVDLFPTLVVDREIRLEGQVDPRWICQGPYAPALRAKFPLAIPRAPTQVAA